MQSLAKFVSKHQENPDKVRLRSKSELLDAQTTLDIENRTGSKRVRNMVFVRADCWDKTAYGPLPTDKIVVETMDGQRVEGVWRNLEKSGHFHFEFYDDQAFRERRREVDGKGPFAAEELTNVKEAVSSGYRATLSRRESMAVQGGEATLESLMAMIEDLPAMASGAQPLKDIGGDGGGDDDDDDSKAGDADEGSPADSEDGDESNEEDARQRLLSMFSGGVAKSASVATAAHPKRSATAHVAASGASGKQTGPKGKAASVRGGGKESPPPQAGVVAPTKAAQAHEVDGRFSRLQAVVRQDCDSLGAALADIAFAEDCEVHSKAGWTQLQEGVLARSKTLSSLLTKVKAAILRIERSRNAEALATDRERLDELARKQETLVSFNAFPAQFLFLFSLPLFCPVAVGR